MALIIPGRFGSGGAWPVQIGAPWHSAWDVEQVLQTYCKQIFALTGAGQFPCCLVGSGSAVRIGNRYFVFCCIYQVRNHTPDKIAKPLSFDAKIMSAATARALNCIDWLARSTFDLFAILKRIADAGAEFRSLAEPWADTGTSTRRLMLAVLGGLADVERDLIRTRTAEGRARAKLGGKDMGRPLKLTAEQRRAALARREAGEAPAEIARSYNVGRMTITRLR